jgi:hypothetical protein
MFEDLMEAIWSEFVSEVCIYVAFVYLRDLACTENDRRDYPFAISYGIERGIQSFACTFIG